MSNIAGAAKMVSVFLKKTLTAKDVKVIMATKVSEGWETKAEVYEENSLIKSLGCSAKMPDKNYYAVKLNDNLEVESYERERN
jgi:hypothetical protein